MKKIMWKDMVCKVPYHTKQVVNKIQMKICSLPWQDWMGNISILRERAVHMIHSNPYRAIAFSFALCLVLTITTAFRYYKNAESHLKDTKSKLQSLMIEKQSIEDKADVLESENEKYFRDISKLKNRANSLSMKIAQLEKGKQALDQKLDEVMPKLGKPSTKVEQVEQPEEMTEDNIVAQSEEATDENAELEKQQEDGQDTTLNTILTIFQPNSSEFGMYYPPVTEQTDQSTIQLLSLYNDLENNLNQEEILYDAAKETVMQTVASISAMPAMWPVRGRISSEFGSRTDPINFGQAFHQGLDIAVPTGTPIKASAAGTVTEARLSSSYGYMVKIDHGNGYETLYAHNSRLLVKTGDMVLQGTIIALSGATGRVTGPHCHFEIRKNNVLQNPRRFLDKS